MQFLTIIGASDTVVTVALQGKWMLKMVHGFDRYLFWSTLVYSNMWSSTVWTCNAGISCSFVQLLRWENIYSTSANSSLPTYFFSLLRLEALKTIFFCNQLQKLIEMAIFIHKPKLKVFRKTFLVLACRGLIVLCHTAQICCWYRVQRKSFLQLALWASWS